MKLKPLALEAVSDRLYNSIDVNDRIHMTSDGNIRFNIVKQSDGLSIVKPKGLWYAIGTAWIDWVRTEMPDWEKDYIYKIDINKSKILSLKNWKDVPKEYRIKSENYKFKPSFILISKDYSGIELLDPSNDYSSWDYGWDVPSGCIWDKDGIKNITKISAVNE
jgi:hypothetical protein